MKKIASVFLVIIILLGIIMPSVEIVGKASTNIHMSINLGQPKIQNIKGKNVISVPVCIDNYTGLTFTISYSVISTSGLSPYISDQNDNSLSWDNGDMSVNVDGIDYEADHFVNVDFKIDNNKGFSVLSDSTYDKLAVDSFPKKGVLINLKFTMPTESGTYDFKLIFSEGVGLTKDDDIEKYVVEVGADASFVFDHLVHEYDNACDNECNICNNLREPSEHLYDNACDFDCNECGVIREVPAHKYTATCDENCNVCGFIRATSTSHRYYNDCDLTCNVCGFEREFNGHEYDNDCDGVCNICSYERTPLEHVYQNECDKVCDSCGYIRNVEDHIFINEKCLKCKLSELLEYEKNEKWNEAFRKYIPVITITDCDSKFSGELVIPENINGYEVVKIGERAFQACRDLEIITIPKGVYAIGERAFDLCHSLKDIVVDPDNEHFYVESGVLFSDYGKRLIKYPACKTEESYVIPSGVEIIEYGAFERCSYLNNISFPDTIKTIGHDAFSECYSIQRVYITDISSWIKIDYGYYNGAYTSCSSPFNNNDADLYVNGERITELVIPEGITDLKYCGFWGCGSIERVIIPDSVSEMESLFLGNNKALKEVEIGENFGADLDRFSDCPFLENIYIDDENKYYNDIDGVVFTADFKKLVVYPCGKTDKKYNIPKNVTVIADSAFSGCECLEEIIIPDSVIQIESYAFAECSQLFNIKLSKDIEIIEAATFRNCYALTSIEIPEGVTTIGTEAFSNCTSLEEVIIPESVTEIGHCAFENCYSLKNITIPKGVVSIGQSAFANCDLSIIQLPKGIKTIREWCFLNGAFKKIEIPEGVISIEYEAFISCNELSEIYLPVSIEEIDSDAFLSCLNLSVVYYGGTIEQWQMLRNSISSGNEALLKARIVYEADGLPVYEPGDLDGNGSVNTTDLAVIKLFLAGSSELDETGLLAGDLNNDDEVNTTDLATLKLMLVGVA